tara:strand:- start:1242 stop:1526 length:285 start_codon:yes stop_codon:yes gene_type:complete
MKNDIQNFIFNATGSKEFSEGVANSAIQLAKEADKNGGHEAMVDLVTNDKFLEVSIDHYMGKQKRFHKAYMNNDNGFADYINSQVEKILTEYKG